MYVALCYIPAIDWFISSMLTSREYWHVFIDCQERLSRKIIMCYSFIGSPFSCAAIINNLLTGDVVDVSSPSDVTVNCIFLSGFTGSAHCTVHYGTDPAYMNLPYSAESTENGTAGDTVSVVLRERLNSSTVYYYTVSAVSGDITVTVRATFATPQYSKQWSNVSVCCIDVLHTYYKPFLTVGCSGYITSNKII